jgi:hypothetical protein
MIAYSKAWNKIRIPHTYESTSGLLLSIRYRNRPNFGHYPNFVHFWLFYVLYNNFEMRHYFNDVKVAKNSDEQCEFEYLFIV